MTPKTKNGLAVTAVVLAIAISAYFFIYKKPTAKPSQGLLDKIWAKMVSATPSIASFKSEYIKSLSSEPLEYLDNWGKAIDIGASSFQYKDKFGRLTNNDVNSGIAI